MLILERRTHDVIIIGGGDSGFPEVEVKVLGVRNQNRHNNMVSPVVRVGVNAPQEVPILRSELLRNHVVGDTSDDNQQNFKDPLDDPEVYDLREESEPEPRKL